MKGKSSLSSQTGPEPHLGQVRSKKAELEVCAAGLFAFAKGKPLVLMFEFVCRVFTVRQ